MLDPGSKTPIGPGLCYLMKYLPPQWDPQAANAARQATRLVPAILAFVDRLLGRKAAGRRVELEPGYVQAHSQNSVAGTAIGNSNGKCLRRCYHFG